MAGVDAEFVVAASEVLDERVSANHYRRCLVGHQSAHRSESRLQPAVIGLGPGGVRVLAGVVLSVGLRVPEIHPLPDSGGFRRLPDTVARAMNPLPAITKLVVSRLRWMFATGDRRDAEILALRHQLLVLQRQIGRAQFTETDRTILAMLSGVFDRRRPARPTAN